jgi:hypothetical protein
VKLDLVMGPAYRREENALKFGSVGRDYAGQGTDERLYHK